MIDRIRTRPLSAIAAAAIAMLCLCPLDAQALIEVGKANGQTKIVTLAGGQTVEVEFKGPSEQ